MALANIAVCFLLLCGSVSAFSLPFVRKPASKFEPQQVLPGLPEMEYDARKLVTTKGYSFEEHTVQTKDNYILKIHRIPHGIKGPQNTDKRPTVFLQHGLLSSSDTWIINLANESLGFILADAGYDVWMGNMRGNVYSRHNAVIKPEDSRFWNFSFNEMSIYDLPIMIDYVYEKTGKQKMFYVGHSQGTLIGFLQFSKEPQWSSERIIQFHAVAPVAYLQTISSPLRWLAPLTNAVKLLFAIIGENEFLPNHGFIRWIAEHACVDWELEEKMCDKMIFFLKQGLTKEHSNMTRLPIYATHDPAGTSSKNIIHYAQMVYSRKLQQYDYGYKDNLKIYGQPQPPQYDLSSFAVPTAFYYGDLDSVADPQDVALLYDQLKHAIISNLAYQNYRHLDFVIGIDASVNVYPKMLELMATANNGH